MTNEEAKKEAIKKAFGDKWDLFTPEYQQHVLTRKHWIDCSVKFGSLKDSRKRPYFVELGFNINEVESMHEFWRPIELKGLEDNNGWTRIEPDLSNLVVGEFEFLVDTRINPDKIITKIFVNEYLLKNKDMVWLVYSHFRPIENIKYPIY